MSGHMLCTPAPCCHRCVASVRSGLHVRCGHLVVMCVISFVIAESGGAEPFSPSPTPPQNKDTNMLGHSTPSPSLRRLGQAEGEGQRLDLVFQVYCRYPYTRSGPYLLFSPLPTHPRKKGFPTQPTNIKLTPPTPQDLVGWVGPFFVGSVGNLIFVGWVG